MIQLYHTMQAFSVTFSLNSQIFFAESNDLKEHDPLMKKNLFYVTWSRKNMEKSVIIEP